MRKFPEPRPPRVAAMKFGSTRPENIQSVQKPFDPNAPAPSRVLRTRPAREPQRDVKELTKLRKRAPATVPDCSERIEQLATPKSAGRKLSPLFP